MISENSPVAFNITKKMAKNKEKRVPQNLIFEYLSSTTIMGESIKDIFGVSIIGKIYNRWIL